jgi:LmbE family N-acetylglucosaminyl deacetylase
MMALRAAARRFGWYLLRRRAPDWVPADAAGVTVVFSPHYDDETLGAGAAVLRLRQMGASVHIVFMTDGSRSHAGAMPGAELAALRHEEGLQAAAMLGVEAGRVVFLEYPEARLALHRDEAVRAAAQLLTRVGATRVFVPSALEPDVWSTDHRTTAEIVFAALEQARIDCEVVEYLVWFWYHWPWVPVLGTNDARQLLRLSWQHAFGLRALRAVNASVEIGEARLRKRQALEQHRTQMFRRTTQAHWAILSDVASGEFLDNFFGSREWFKVHRRAWRSSC